MKRSANAGFASPDRLSSESKPNVYRSGFHVVHPHRDSLIIGVFTMYVSSVSGKKDRRKIRASPKLHLRKQAVEANLQLPDRQSLFLLYVECRPDRLD